MNCCDTGMRSNGQEHDSWCTGEPKSITLIVPPAPAPDLAAMIKAAVEAALAPTTAKLQRLEEENDTLRETLASGRSNNLQGPDFPRNPDAARSVVIMTRPVMDNPEQYAQGGKQIVDTGGLVKNDASPMSGKNKE